MTTTTGGSWARARAKLVAQAAAVLLGPLVGGCTALLGVTDVTEAADDGGSVALSGDAATADGTTARGGGDSAASDGAMARGGDDGGADSTTTRVPDAALDSTLLNGAEAAVGSAGGEAGEDVATPSAGEGGPLEAGGCPATDLLCDGGCVPNDTHHCGTCGNDCTVLKNIGTVACMSGTCSFSCASGWGHCRDAGAPGGCETDLSTATNCGACGHACSTATPLCSASGAAPTCVNGCTASAPTLCANACVDTTTSTSHCGSCMTVCTTADPHAQPGCAHSSCTSTCNTGYTPCPAGCVDAQTDKANCGTCGKTCTGATPLCRTGACVACIPASTRCTGAVPQTCDASGAWQSSPVTAGQCGAVCTPGAKQCSGNPSDSVQACGADGKWDGAVTPCAPFGCGGTACKLTCASHADCSAGNFCWQSACVKIAKIAAGAVHTCALTTAGGVQCWGNNSFGQLGNNATTLSPVPLPVAVSGLSSGVSAIAAGAYHTCALTTAGGLLCWGRGDHSQLGNNMMSDSPVPVPVTGLSPGVSAIAAGDLHTCALTTVGGVQCWGANTAGVLGSNATGSVPATVSGLSPGVSAIAAGSYHMCAVATAGVQCWGDNFAGQLGDNTMTNNAMPVNVSGLSSPVSAIATGGFHTCALTTAGGVQCWGSNSAGQLGNNMTDSATPLTVSGLSPGVSAIAAGDAHTCAVTMAGGVQCWGSNVHGELGNGAMTNSSMPIGISGVSSDVTAIAARSTHTCALTTASGVRCWGQNSSGQLGNNKTTDSSVPVPVVEP